MSKVPDSDGRPHGVLAGGMDAVTLGPLDHLPDTESFDDFYRRTYGGLLVLARALVGSSAEDVAQETMLVHTAPTTSSAWRCWSVAEADPSSQADGLRWALTTRSCMVSSAES